MTPDPAPRAREIREALQKAGWLRHVIDTDAVEEVIAATLTEGRGPETGPDVETWDAAIRTVRAASLCLWCRSGPAPVAYLTGRTFKPGEHYVIGGRSVVCTESTVIAALICARDGALAIRATLGSEAPATPVPDGPDGEPR